MKKGTKYIIITVSVLLFIFSIVSSWMYTVKYGGVDLRCRIIGARLSGAGQSPYFFKSTASTGVFLLDPNDNPLRKTNGNVVTPAVLTVIYPLAQLPYFYIRVLWTVLQYLFILSAFIMLLKKRPGYFWGKDIQVSLFILAVFTGSANWFYNIERGQVYTFYLFLFALIFWLHELPWKYNHLASGFVAGLSVWIRFLMAGLALPFLIRRDIKWIAAFGTGLITGACLFLLPKTGEWKEYFAAMEEYGREIPVSNDIATAPHYIEGMNNLQEAFSFKTAGLTTIQFYAKTRGLLLSSKTLVIFYVVLVAILMLLAMRKRIVLLSAENMFGFGFLLYISAELFLVGYRGGYNIIQWFFPAMLIARKWPEHKYLLPLFVLGWLLANWLPVIPHQGEIAEIILFVVLAVFLFNKDRSNTGPVLPSA